MKKNGQCNVVFTNMENRRQLYLADIFTTCVDIRWRYLLLLFCISFIMSWLVFGFIFYSVSFAHGDFEEPQGEGLLYGPSSEHIVGGQTQKMPCIYCTFRALLVRSCSPWRPRPPLVMDGVVLQRSVP